MALLGIATCCTGPFVMVLGLFRRSSNESVIARLYAAIVAASRQPALYVDMHIPDTFEGRFESLTLHAVLVLRRLREGPAPGPDMAQHLIDTVFRHFDRTLREMGVGDTSVPKRMKQMAEAFLGRSASYDAALREGLTPLASALRRNVYGDEQDGVALARYAIAGADALASISVQQLIDAAQPFPDAAAFAAQAAAEIDP